MQRLGAQEVPQLNLGADNQQQHGSTGSSSSNSADGSSSGSSSIPGLQSLSRLQQNLQLWAGVNRLQRKVCTICSACNIATGWVALLPYDQTICASGYARMQPALSLLNIADVRCRDSTRQLPASRSGQQ